MIRNGEMDMKLKIIIVLLVCALLLSAAACAWVRVEKAKVEREETARRGELLYCAYIYGTWAPMTYIELYDSGYLTAYDCTAFSEHFYSLPLEELMKAKKKGAIFKEYLSQETFREINHMLSHLPEDYYYRDVLDWTVTQVHYKGETHFFHLYDEENAPHKEFIFHLLSLANNLNRKYLS